MDHQRVDSCKRALYEEFIKCGAATWERVLIALQKSNESDIAELVKLKVKRLYSTDVHNK